MKYQGSSFGVRKQTEKYFNYIGLTYKRSVRVAYHTFFRTWFYTSYEIQDKYRLVKRARTPLEDTVDTNNHTPA